MLIFVLLVIALLMTLAHGGRPAQFHLWPAVLVLSLAELIAHWPAAIR